MMQSKSEAPFLSKNPSSAVGLGVSPTDNDGIDFFVIVHALGVTVPSTFGMSSEVYLSKIWASWMFRIDTS